VNNTVNELIFLVILYDKNQICVILLRTIISFL